MKRDFLTGSGFWVLVGFLLVFGAGTAAVAVWAWSYSGLDLNQHIAAVAAAFTGGAFLLATLAAAVALLAYWLTIQRPDLVATVLSDDIEGQVIRVGAAPPENGDRAVTCLPGYMRPFKFVTLDIRLRNTTGWSARNVAVTLRFRGIRRVGDSWTVVARDKLTGDPVALLWEGGADLPIHGHQTRELPTVKLTQALLEAPGDDCQLEVEVFAENFNTSVTYAVKWTPDGGPPSGRGAIEGFCGYPSSGVPAIRIYAVPIGTDRGPTRVELPAGLPGKYRWFRINNLVPGEYHIVAYTVVRPGLAGGYTVLADRARSTTDSPPRMAGGRDRRLVALPVISGQLTSGVRITDWSSTDAFPPEPSGR